ncbi:MAG TPA: KedN5 family methylcobalamin-dependent radical SAM C-methyltransferase [Arenibaculum sp.]|nr:KedN5 family methylcobalamin-dependent radical SAM C-methyltransferase [Arenibaculum sp.]
MRRKKIWLVQQAVWRARQGGPQSMPLAAGYFKAVAEADDQVKSEVDVRIFNFNGADTTVAVAKELFFEEMPDMVCFSVMGWNYHLFGRVSETFRQMNPDGVVIWGGPHVAYQAQRAFALFPAVDVIVNGEGEWTFLELLRAYLSGRSKHELDGIRGISFKRPDGTLVETEARERILNLDEIPSPFLNGTLPLTDRNGRFLYDAALMETNRGCPYSCAFCYWGGAIGQKVRAFSLDRLREEIDILGRAGAKDIVLCDANFGLFREDEEFFEICVKAREKYGYPRHIMTSWAKNKGAVFYRIVQRMKEEDFHAAVNLALQSLSEPTLEVMGRKNMKLNDWEELAHWLHQEGLDVYGELIWGCPGETRESFLEGYDQLARHVSRIAIYPHLILPNTTYSNKRGEYGIVTYRSPEHDFELVLSHNTMSIADNRQMHRFLFLARVVTEHLLFRHIWQPLRELAGLTQSRVLLSLDNWLDRQNTPALLELRARRDLVVDTLDPGSANIEAGLQCFFADDGLGESRERWWRDEIVTMVPEELGPFFVDLFRYDWLTRPIYRPTGAATLPRVTVEGTEYYVRRDVEFDYDIPALGVLLREDPDATIERSPRVMDIYYRTGFCNDMALYHNAHNLAFFGIPDLEDPPLVARILDGNAVSTHVAT